jgi:hypothetical protein
MRAVPDGGEPRVGQAGDVGAGGGRRQPTSPIVVIARGRNATDERVNLRFDRPGNRRSVQPAGHAPGLGRGNRADRDRDAAGRSAQAQSAQGEGQEARPPADRCQAQEDPCASIFGALCEHVFPAGEVDQCKAEVDEICAALGRCDADTALNRLVGLLLV